MLDPTIPPGELEFREIADSLPTLCWIADINGKVLWFNQRWHDYCGTQPDTDIDSWDWDSIHDPDAMLDVRANWQQCIQTGENFEQTFPLRGKDGFFRSFLTRGIPIRNPEGEISRWLGINIDISEQIRIERELRDSEERLRTLNQTLEARVEERAIALKKTEEQLRQSQKMEAVGQLTGGLAHDFNNLLTGIMGNLELMQIRIQQNKYNDLDRFLTSARTAGTRAAALTQRLLAFSRRQTLDPRPTKVNELIISMEELIRRTIGPEVTLEVHGDLKLGTAFVDGPQLENSLLNLCINSRDAMSSGGKITIDTSNILLDHVAAHSLDVAPGRYLRIRVMDNGQGMTQDTMDKAFDPFFTTKPIGQGTGLGLSMIYGFCRQSKGHVTLESDLEVGTTVTLYLPRCEAGVLAAPLVPQIIAEGNNQTILLVDDEETIRYLAIEVLEEAGYHVIGAADGLEAMKILNSDMKLDLMITDVGLPNGMNGRQVADAARNLRPELKILFITGYTGSAVIGDTLSKGMELLTKPFSLAELVSKAASLL